MPSGIQLVWEHGLPGLGMPPDPEAADSFKGFVKYRGGWNRNWDFDDESTSHRLGSPDMPNGAYTIRLHGYRNGVYSEPAETNYTHTTGTAPIEPVNGDPPPDGDDSVATPTDLVVTEAA